MKREILVVEDEPGIADNITYALKTEGFLPCLAESGKEALELLSTRGFDLVILDVGLPDKSGFEVAREILRIKEVPFIFLTARSEEIDRVLGLEIGADDYIVKPFSPRELVARVRAILRRTEKQTSSKPIPSTAFELDSERNLILFFKTPLDLSAHEYRLLQVLIKRPGKVFSREELMNRAWEEPDMTLERTVDAHIKNIRKKLKALRPELDPIITQRGFGYSLREGL